MIIYDCLKGKIPKVIALKQRENEKFLTISSSNLEIYHLNETAKEFIKHCDGKNTVEEIVKNFTDIFDVDEIVLKADIINIIRDLQWKKLIILE